MNNLRNLEMELKQIVNEPLKKNTIDKLQNLLDKTKKQTDTKSAFYFEFSSTIWEAMGDTYMAINKQLDAEKAYRSMLALSMKLYEMDQNKDYRYAYSSYKLASYYRVMMGCTKVEEKPKKFNEMQSKVFEIASSLYMNAISSTMAHAKMGIVAYAKLHSNAMSELALLYSGIGNYDKACFYGVDGINVTRSIYKTLNSKDEMYLLINRINTLATLFKLNHKEEKTIEYLKESIELAKTRIKEDPVVLKMMIGKCMITLGSVYAYLKDFKNADDNMEQGLEYIAQANKDSGYRMKDELIKGYIKVGNHYHYSEREFLAKGYYNTALQKASLAYEETKENIYLNLMNDLTKKGVMN